jgi:hypothetical protein
MRQLSLSWTEGVGEIATGRHQTAPLWSDVEYRLERAKRCGSVGLDIIDAPESGPQSLQVFCDQAGYLLMLGELDGEDHHIRSFTNAEAAPGKVAILGEYWDARNLCQDFAVVKAVFREFFDTGDVSHAVLT